MTISSKKKLAAYYTPIIVTNALSKWAIRTAADKILEPSFGGCNFLLSSIASLKARGCRAPVKNIIGCDIDPNAFKFLEQKKISQKNFVLGDFLQVSLKNNFTVDAVLGNPPYVSIHKMEQDYKKNLFKRYKKHDFKIARRSSLWVYFIVHSLTYLKEGGRMAWVVPDGLSFTHYSDTFLNQLEEKFAAVSIIRIQERFFMESGTHEKTSFLLCENYLGGSCKTKTYEFADLEDALTAVSENTLLSKTALVGGFGENVNYESRNIEFKSIKDFFTIHIGIVIGDSKRLIMNESKAHDSIFYPKYLYPIVSKGKQLTELSINRRKLVTHFGDSPIYIVDGIKLERDNKELFEEFLLSIPTDILLNQTFQNRAKLFGYDDYKHPDAFLTYYSQGGPKIIINENQELNSTNSVHRLFFKSELPNSQELLKFFALQTFCDFMHNETIRVSRQYGNHMYKFEPSDAANIPLMVPKKFNKGLRTSLEKTYCSVVKNIDENRVNNAKKIAFKFFQNLIQEP